LGIRDVVSGFGVSGIGVSGFGVSGIRFRVSKFPGNPDTKQWLLRRVEASESVGFEMASIMNERLTL